MTDSTSVGSEITTSDTTTSTDMVAENNVTNNPENNKKLAEIVMMESIRDKYKLTFNMPDVFKGLHTNKFLYMELSDQFYEKHYEDIIEAIKDTKFTRYAGFEKGRFFVEKYVWGGGKKGKHSKITVNPLANNYSSYMKAQQEAEKSLIQALNSGGTGNANVNGNDCTETAQISTRTFSDAAFEKLSKTIIGNSNSNYAQAVANLSCEQAIKSIVFSYDKHRNNKYCPQQLAKSWPKIHANCADHARMVKVICDVKNQPCIIYHGSDHYWNYVKINGKWESIDLCTPRQGSGSTWDGHVRNSAGWNMCGKV